MFYYRGEKNFGDAINPFLIEKLFNVSIEYSEPLKADLLGIGSIAQTLFASKMSNFKLCINKYLRYSTVNIWGSGFNGSAQYFQETRPHYKNPETFLRRVKVHALRGKLSKQRMEIINSCIYPEITLGDPGLLVSFLINKPVSKKYQLGIIPHYVDMGHPVFVQIKNKIPYSIIINVQDDPLKVIKQIAECEVIVSSALHGLISADSLSIPNKWILVSDKIIGKNFKFYDYYSVFDIETPKPINFDKTIFNKNLLNKIPEEYNISKKIIKDIQDKLIRSFPY